MPHPKQTMLALLGALAGLLASLAPASETTPPPAPQGVRFLIDTDGLYALDADGLTSAGLGLPLDSGALRLFDRFGEVPVRVEDGGDGTIDAGSADRLLFVGFYPRGEHTTRAIMNDAAPYWLIVDPAAAGEMAARRDVEGPPRRYETVSAEEALKRHPEAPAMILYNSWVRHERDWGFIRWAGGDARTTDFYIWQTLSTSGDYERVLDKIYFPSGAANRIGVQPEALPVQLRIKLHGISRTSLPDAPDHLAQIHFNGHLLGEAAWEGQATETWETEVPTDILAAPSKVVLRTPDERSEVVDEMYLDWVELRHPRYPSGNRVTQEWIGLEGYDRETSPSLRITSTNWAQDSAWLVDCADGRWYEPVAAKKTENQDKVQWRYEWSFGLPASEMPGLTNPADTPLAIFTPASILVNGWKEPQLWHSVLPSSVVGDAATPPQNLIVVHPSLRSEADRLASFREEGGVPTALVETTAIYDRYSDGLIAPSALQAFLREVLASPEGASIRYVTLFGDASFDYKGVNEKAHPERGISAANLVPPLYFDSGHWNRPVYPADHLYVADPNNEERPLAAVGRIPAASLAEARAYVDKVMAYEAAAVAAAGEPAKSLLVSSWESSFSSLLAESEKSLKGFDNHQLVAEVDDYDRSVANLVDGLNGGCDVLYYVGHGGSFVWRVGPVDFSKQKDLFTPAHILALTNRGHYPIVFVSSCYTVSFDHARSLGESFIFAPERGAIAVVGSPWKTSVHPNHQFNVSMMEWLYDGKTREQQTDIRHDPGAPRLGDAFLSAKLHGELRGDAQIGFTLLGDPALRVRIPPIPLPPPAEPTPEPTPETTPETPTAAE